MENKRKLTIQEYLSLGYVYLIFLGLTVDVIFYKILGVNILSYSTILDILISPINILVRDFRVFVIVCLMVASGTYFSIKLAPKLHEISKKKGWYFKYRNIEKLDKKYSKKTSFEDVLTLVAFLLFSMFVGFSIGRGPRIKSDLRTGDFKLDHVVIFQDDSKKEIKVIGQNSTYLFYVEKGDTEISITPIGQNIKEIQRLSDK